MNERDVVFVPLGPDHRPHPAVVLAVRPTGVVLTVAGTGTARDREHLLVRRGSRDAQALGLYKDTYFYFDAARLFPRNLVTLTTHRCPPLLYRELDRLTAEAIRKAGM